MSSHYGKYGCVYFDRGGPLQRMLGDFTLISIQLSLICQFGDLALAWIDQSGFSVVIFSPLQFDSCVY